MVWNEKGCTYQGTQPDVIIIDELADDYTHADSGRIYPMDETFNSIKRHIERSQKLEAEMILKAKQKAKAKQSGKEWKRLKHNKFRYL